MTAEDRFLSDSRSKFFVWLSMAIGTWNPGMTRGEDKPDLLGVTCS